MKKMQESYMKYSLDFLLEVVAIRGLRTGGKRHMLKGHTFAFKKVRHYNLFKASDAPMIYAHVLDAELPDFNQNVSAVLHYN